MAKTVHFKPRRARKLVSVEEDVASKFYRGCSKNPPRYLKSSEICRTYWNEVFDRIDKDKIIPDHHRIETLEKVINPKVLPFVIEILDIPGPIPDSVYENQAFALSVVNFHPGRSMSRLTEFHDHVSHKDFKVRKNYRIPQKRYDTDTMYRKFLQRPPDAASRWRPEGKRQLGYLGLAAQCEVITELVARNFVKWMDDLGGTKEGLTVEGIKALFEIGFTASCADSVSVKVRELNAVPTSIALAQRCPDMSYSAQLYKQLYRDVKQARGRTKNYAFGTMLPLDRRVPEESNSNLLKWLENERVPQRLADMEVVWEGIEKFRTTRGYCKWLSMKTDVAPPKYLEKMVYRTKPSEEFDTTSKMSQTSIKRSASSSKNSFA